MVPKLFKGGAQQVTKEKNVHTRLLSKYFSIQKLLLFWFYCIYWNTKYLSLLRNVKKTAIVYKLRYNIYLIQNHF